VQQTTILLDDLVAAPGAKYRAQSPLFSSIAVGWLQIQKGQEIFNKH
jgi:hypothetical protein